MATTDFPFISSTNLVLVEILWLLVLLTCLQHQVGVEGKSAEQVAKEFLQEQGLLKK